MLLDPDLAAWEILKGFLLKAVSRRPPDGAERNILEKLTSNHMRRITPEEQKDAAQVIFEEVKRKNLDLARIEYLLHTFNWNESGHDMVRCEWRHDEGRWGGGLASLYEAETDDGEKVLPIAVSDVLDDTIRRVGSEHTDDAMTMKGAFTTDNDIFSIMHDSHATKLRFTTLLDQMVENNPEGISETAKDKKGEFKFKWFRRNMATARESKTVKDAFKHMMETDEELTEKQTRGKAKKVQADIDKRSAHLILRDYYRSLAANDYKHTLQGNQVHDQQCPNHHDHEYNKQFPAGFPCSCDNLWDYKREQAIAKLDKDTPLPDRSHPDNTSLMKAVERAFQESSAILIDTQGVQARNKEGEEIAHKPRIESWLTFWKSQTVDVRKTILGLTSFYPPFDADMPYLYTMFKAKGLGAGVGGVISDGEVTMLLDEVAAYESKVAAHNPRDSALTDDQGRVRWGHTQLLNWLTSPHEAEGKYHAEEDVGSDEPGGIGEGALATDPLAETPSERPEPDMADTTRTSLMVPGQKARREGGPPFPITRFHNKGEIEDMEGRDKQSRAGDECVKMIEELNAAGWGRQEHLKNEEGAPRGTDPDVAEELHQLNKEKEEMLAGSIPPGHPGYIEPGVMKATRDEKEAFQYMIATSKASWRQKILDARKKERLDARHEREEAFDETARSWQISPASLDYAVAYHGFMFHGKVGARLRDLQDALFHRKSKAKLGPLTVASDKNPLFKKYADKRFGHTQAMKRVGFETSKVDCPTCETRTVVPDQWNRIKGKLVPYPLDPEMWTKPCPNCKVKDSSTGRVDEVHDYTKSLSPEMIDKIYDEMHEHFHDLKKEAGMQLVERQGLEKIGLEDCFPCEGKGYVKNKWGEEKKCDQCGDAYGKNMPAGKVPNVQKFLDAMMDHDDRYLNSEQVQHKIRGALIEDDVSFRNSQKRVIREKQLRDFFQHGLLPNTGTHVLMHNPHLHVKGTWNGIESAAPGAFNTEALMLMRKKAIDSCVQFSNKELKQAMYTALGEKLNRLNDNRTDDLPWHFNKALRSDHMTKLVDLLIKKPEIADMTEASGNRMHQHREKIRSHMDDVAHPDSFDSSPGYYACSSCHGTKMARNHENHFVPHSTCTKCTGKGRMVEPARYDDQGSMTHPALHARVPTGINKKRPKVNRSVFHNFITAFGNPTCFTCDDAMGDLVTSPEGFGENRPLANSDDVSHSNTTFRKMKALYALMSTEKMYSDLHRDAKDADARKRFEDDIEKLHEEIKEMAHKEHHHVVAAIGRGIDDPPPEGVEKYDLRAVSEAGKPSVILEKLGAKGEWTKGDAPPLENIQCPYCVKAYTSGDAPKGKDDEIACLGDMDGYHNADIMKGEFSAEGCPHTIHSEPGPNPGEAIWHDMLYYDSLSPKVKDLMVKTWARGPTLQEMNIFSDGVQNPATPEEITRGAEYGFTEAQVNRHKVMQTMLERQVGNNAPQMWGDVLLRHYLSTRARGGLAPQDDEGYEFNKHSFGRFAGGPIHNGTIRFAGSNVETPPHLSGDEYERYSHGKSLLHEIQNLDLTNPRDDETMRRMFALHFLMPDYNRTIINNPLNLRQENTGSRVVTGPDGEPIIIEGSEGKGGGPDVKREYEAHWEQIEGRNKSRRKLSYNLARKFVAMHQYTKEEQEPIRKWARKVLHLEDGHYPSPEDLRALDDPKKALQLSKLLNLEKAWNNYILDDRSTMVDAGLPVTIFNGAKEENIDDLSVPFMDQSEIGDIIGELESSYDEKQDIMRHGIQSPDHDGFISPSEHYPDQIFMQLPQHGVTPEFADAWNGHHEDSLHDYWRTTNEDGSPKDFLDMKCRHTIWAAAEHNIGPGIVDDDGNYPEWYRMPDRLEDLMQPGSSISSQMGWIRINRMLERRRDDPEASRQGMWSTRAIGNRDNEINDCGHMTGCKVCRKAGHVTVQKFLSAIPEWKTQYDADGIESGWPRGRGPEREVLPRNADDQWDLTHPAVIQFLEDHGKIHAIAKKEGFDSSPFENHKDWNDETKELENIFNLSFTCPACNGNHVCPTCTGHGGWDPDEYSGSRENSHLLLAVKMALMKYGNDMYGHTFVGPRQVGQTESNWRSQIPPSLMGPGGKSHLSHYVDIDHDAAVINNLDDEVTKGYVIPKDQYISATAGALAGVPQRAIPRKVPIEQSDERLAEMYQTAGMSAPGNTYYEHKKADGTPSGIIVSFPPSHRLWDDFPKILSEKEKREMQLQWASLAVEDKMSGLGLPPTASIFHARWKRGIKERQEETTLYPKPGKWRLDEQGRPITDHQGRGIRMPGRPRELGMGNLSPPEYQEAQERAYQAEQLGLEVAEQAKLIEPKLPEPKPKKPEPPTCDFPGCVEDAITLCPEHKSLMASESVKMHQQVPSNHIHGGLDGVYHMLSAGYKYAGKKKHGFVEWQYPDKTIDDMRVRVEAVAKEMMGHYDERREENKKVFQDGLIDEPTYKKSRDELNEEFQKNLNAAWSEERANWPRPDKHVYYYTHPETGNVPWTAQEKEDVEGGIPPMPQNNRVLHGMRPESEDNHKTSWPSGIKGDASHQLFGVAPKMHCPECQENVTGNDLKMGVCPKCDKALPGELRKEWANVNNILSWLPGAMYQRERLLDRTKRVSKGEWDSALGPCTNCDNTGEYLQHIGGGKYEKTPCTQCLEIGEEGNKQRKTFRDWNDALVQYHTPNVKLVRIDKSDPSGESYDEISEGETRKVLARLKDVAGGGKVNVKEKLRDMDESMREVAQGGGMEEVFGLKEGQYEHEKKAEAAEHKFHSVLNLGTIKNDKGKDVASFKPRTPILVPTVNRGTFSKGNYRDPHWGKAVYSGHGDIEAHCKSLNKLLRGTGARSKGLAEIFRILEVDSLSDLGSLRQDAKGVVGWDYSDLLSRKVHQAKKQKSDLDYKKSLGPLNKYEETKHDDLEYLLEMVGHDAWTHREVTNDKGEVQRQSAGHPLGLAAEMEHDKGGRSYRIVPIDNHGFSKRDALQTLRYGAFLEKQTEVEPGFPVTETSQEMAQKMLAPNGILGDTNSGLKKLGMNIHAFGGTVYAGEMDRIHNEIDGLDETSMTLRNEAIFTPGGLWADICEMTKKVDRLKARLEDAPIEHFPTVVENLELAEATLNAFTRHYNKEMLGDPNIPGSGVLKDGQPITLPSLEVDEDTQFGQKWEVQRPSVWETPHDITGPIQHPPQLMNSNHVGQDWRLDEDPESDTYGERLYKDEDGNSYPLTNSHTGQPLTLEELRGLSEDGQKLLRRREKEAGLDKNEEVDKDGNKLPDFGKYNASGSTISPLHEPGSDRIKIARDQYISTIGGAVSKEPKEYHYPIMPARQSHRPTDDMMVTTEGTPKGWPTGRSRSLTDAELPAGYMGPPPPETTPEELEAQGHDVRTSEDPMVMAWSNILKNIKISQ